MDHSMSLSENPFWREMMQRVSKLGPLSGADLEAALSRSAITVEMDAKAMELYTLAFDTWKKSSKVFGGGMTLDGWSSRQATGEIGIELYSLLEKVICPMLSAGKKSRAVDYEEKLLEYVYVLLGCNVF